jgi:hypothetical protein
MVRHPSHYQLMEEKLMLSTREQSHTLISILLNISVMNKENYYEGRLASQLGSTQEL